MLPPATNPWSLGLQGPWKHRDRHIVAVSGLLPWDTATKHSAKFGLPVKQTAA